MNNLNLDVDSFFENAKKWKEEMILLRSIIRQCGLNEEFKWMHPCYTYNSKNVVLIHAFKNYCALLIFKGVLLKDKAGILIQQTENVQDRRQIRFLNTAEILKSQNIIKAYILEAIELEKAGVKIEFKKSTAFKIPQELQHAFINDPKLKAAFEALTPGRQRAYLLYFSAAKQQKTRETRIEKYTATILSGKGLDDV